MYRHTASLLALFCAVPAAALAQESAPPPSEAGMGEVVVTATRRAEDLSNVPLAVQAFGGEELERRGVRDIKELLSAIPGATVVGDHNPTNSVYHMRGTGAFDVAGDAGVGYYIDEVAFGVPNSQTAPPSRMFDLERLEVLRGPQGTLWGQGSLGGTIRYITRAPDLDEFSFGTELTLNQVEDGEGGYSADAVMNIPIVAGKFGIRLVAGTEHVPGWVEPYLQPDVEDVNGVAFNHIRLKALWEPTEDLSIAYTYWQIEADADYGTLVSFNPDGTPSNTFTRQDPTRFAGSRGLSKFSSLTLNWDLGFATLTSATGYAEHDNDWTQGLESLPGLTLTTVRNHWDVSASLNQEVRLVSAGDGPLGWVLGGYYQNTDTLNDGSSRLSLQVESYAAFGEVSYDFFDGKLTPLVGLRYFHDDRGGVASTLAGVVTSRPSGSSSNMSPRFNLRYRPTDDQMYYINIAHGFRPGPVQGQATVDNLILNGVANAKTVLDPAEAWSYEIGGKWELLDGRLQLEADIFQVDYENIQRLGIYGAAFGVAEAGAGTVKGVEFGINYMTPIEGLTASFTGMWNTSEFTSRATSSNTPVGGPLPGTPDYNFTLGLHHEAHLSDNLVANSSLTFSQRGSQLALGTTGIYRKGDEITDLGLRFGLRRDNIEVILYGTNLLDERGETYPLTLTSGGWSGFSYYPRRIGVTLRASF